LEEAVDLSCDRLLMMMMMMIMNVTQCRLVVTDVSGHSICPIFKGQVVLFGVLYPRKSGTDRMSRNVGHYQSTLRRTNLHRGGNLNSCIVVFILLTTAFFQYFNRQILLFLHICQRQNPSFITATFCSKASR
jgi:hypothetical protein